MRHKRDERTLDLLDWKPPQVVQTPADADVGASTLRGRMARTVALVLRESTLKRDEIVERMAAFLGEKVSLSSLDQCASQAREDHTLSAIRVAALAHATGDMRVFEVLLAPMSYHAVHERYLPAIDAELMAERAEELSRKADEMRENAKLARRQWKGRQA